MLGTLNNMKYQIAERQCQDNINEKGNRVCERCGANIIPLKTVDNSGNPTYWSAVVILL